jgi:hypothetical protein
MLSKQFSFLILFFAMQGYAMLASAQERPFLYTLTLPTVARGANVHFDAGWGDGSLGFSEAPFLDYRAGGLWRFHSNWTALGNVGIGQDDESNTFFTGQAQMFYSFRNEPQQRFNLSAGGGIRFERDGSNVALMSLIGGWKAPSWRFDGNMVLEKADAPDRDPVDLIVSMGWLHSINNVMSLGVEAVGQDLEGFWDPNEAEGGARILLGPTLHLNSGPWEAGLGGGYVFWPTFNNRTSGADRAFGNSRWALQLSFTRDF